MQVEYAGNLLKDTQKIVLENSKETILHFSKENPSYRFPSEIEEALTVSEQQSAQLYIFVSTSMPKEVIRAYYKEAAKYKGVLVFKGLPNGSFKELQLLILELQESNNTQQLNKGSSHEVGVIIDDELFKKLNVETVPTIALVRLEECFENSSCKTNYDSIKGNVRIKYALEVFAKDGDLREEASRFLEDRRGLQ